MAFKTLKVISTSCLVAGILMFNPLAGHAETNTPGEQIATSKISELANTQYSIEKAIQNSKQLFDIDDSYDVFKSSYNTYDGKKQWNLNWSRSEQPSGSISVQVNAVTGEILDFNHWEELPPGEKFYGLPKYSRQDLVATADQWVQKLAPAYYQQVKLQPEQNQYVPTYDERGPEVYHYNYARVVNGVVYPENSITVRINSDTGQLESFYLHWDEKATFPPAENIIPTEKATDIFAEQVELAYFQPYPKPNEAPAIKLVYRQKIGKSLFIDAHNGEIIKTPGYRLFGNDLGGAGETTKEPEKGVTPAEQQEMEKIKNILDSNEALKFAKAAINAPAGVKVYETFLEENYYVQQKLWNFYLETKDYNASVSVDAVTGELVSFRKWGESYAQQAKPKYTLEQGQEIAEEYLKKIKPEHAAQVKFVGSSIENYWIENSKPNPVRYAYHYERLVDGLPFANNGFSLEVNAAAGEIMYYGSNWWQPEFPPAEALIAQNEAADIFLADQGLSIEYKNLWHQDDHPEIKLVYFLKDTPSHILDANSGAYLDWQGRPIPAKGTSEFTDTTGHPAEQAIKGLAQANIIRSVDDKFYPDRTITKMEALTWLVTSKYNYIYNQPAEDPEKMIIDEALRMGLIDKNETENLPQELSRVELAKLMVNYLHYGGAAKLADIYVLKTKDAGQVPPHLRGYAAISLALGLQTEMEGNYNPHTPIPRGYAALSIYRLLQLEK